MPKGLYIRNKTELKRIKDLGLKNKGITNFHYGKKISEYQRKMIIQANKKRKGNHYPKISIALRRLYKDKTRHGRWKGDDKSSTQRRRAFKFGALGMHTWGDWQKLKRQYGFRCPSCGKLEPKIKLTEDHIIPLTRGGSDFIENIQPLCGLCNRKKYTKIIKYDFTIKGNDSI